MSAQAIEEALANAKPEVLDQAREILRRAVPLAQQVLSGAVAPAALRPTDLQEATAAANELDDKLVGHIEDRRKAHDLAVLVLKTAAQVALKFAIAGVA